MSACLMLLALFVSQGQASQDLPFERLGKCLTNARSPSETLVLGAFELGWPLELVTAAGVLEPTKRPREWKSMATLLVELQRRWVVQLGREDEDLAADFDVLAARIQRLSGTSKLTESCMENAAEQHVRAALLGVLTLEHATIVQIAPTRAHYVACLGAEGIARPAMQAFLWNDAARRCVAQRIADAALLLSLELGPDEAKPWFDGEPLDPSALRQQLVHNASHMLSHRTLPTPAWLHEALAIRDSVALNGLDETLCTGHRPRDRSVFDDSPASLLNFLLASTERSPYRGKASSDLFVSALRAALEEDGFVILDLERSRPGLIARGPFLGTGARLPEEVSGGPNGLREGFAEFFRAYCTAFVEWLSHERTTDGAPLLATVLQDLWVSVLPRASDNTPPGLETVLLLRCGRTLGGNQDPEKDLEAAFCAWLRAGR